METFWQLNTRHNFHWQEVDHPNKRPNLALTQTPITKILPPPTSNNTIHHIQFISSYIGIRTKVAPTSQVFNPVPIVKNHGTQHFCIDFCEIQNLHAAIELLNDTQPLEQRLVQVELVNKIQRQSLQYNEAHKKQEKASFDCHMNPRTFTEGEIVLRYDVAKEALGPGKFETLWEGLYIIKHCLLKGAYILT